jgi:hypothetical protein
MCEVYIRKRAEEKAEKEQFNKLRGTPNFRFVFTDGYCKLETVF